MDTQLVTVTRSHTTLETVHSVLQPSVRMEMDASAATSLLQQTGCFDVSSSCFDSLRTRAQFDPTVFPDILSDELTSSVKFKATQRKAKCFYCKKPGHRIRTCRYKLRRDKLRKSTLQSPPAENSPLQIFPTENSLSAEISLPNETNSKVLCCSTADSMPKRLHEIPLDNEVSIQNDSLPSNVSVISNHHDLSSVMPMKQNWNLYLLTGLSFSWLSSLNPFCLKRCKRELLYLMSFSWINDLLCLLSCNQRQHVADENLHMVAYCTIDNSQPLRGRYKLQSKPSVQTWKKKKKKRR